LSPEECDHIVALAKPKVLAVSITLPTNAAPSCTLQLNPTLHSWLMTASSSLQLAHCSADEKEHGCRQGRTEHRGQHQDKLWHILEVESSGSCAAAKPASVIRPALDTFLLGLAANKSLLSSHHISGPATILMHSSVCSNVRQCCECDLCSLDCRAKYHSC